MPVAKALLLGVAGSALAKGMGTVVVLHLAFGLLAGAIGVAVSRPIRRASAPS